MNLFTRFALYCCLLFPLAASGTSITWTLEDVSFGDGNTASGSFMFDADTNTYSGINITSTGSGANYTYLRPGSGTLDYGFTAVETTGSDLIGEYGFALVFVSSLTNLGGSVDFGVNGLFSPYESICADFDCTLLLIANQNIVTSGRVTSPGAVPIPAALWLFGSGLLGLIGVARRKVRV